MPKIWTHFIVGKTNADFCQRLGKNKAFMLCIVGTTAAATTTRSSNNNAKRRHNFFVRPNPIKLNASRRQQLGSD